MLLLHEIYKNFMRFLCNNIDMNDASTQLKERVSEYKKRIHDLEKLIKNAPDKQKTGYDFELSDLKAKLSLAEAELKNTWDETSDATQ